MSYEGHAMPSSAEKIQTSGPVEIRLGNLAITAAGPPERGKAAGYKVYLNGKEVACRDITIRGGHNELWAVDLTFLPTDEEGHPIF